MIKNLKTWKLRAKKWPIFGHFSRFLRFFRFFAKKTSFENRRFLPEPQKSRKKGVFSRFSVFFCSSEFQVFPKSANFGKFWCFSSSWRKKSWFLLIFDKTEKFQKKFKKPFFRKNWNFTPFTMPWIFEKKLTEKCHFLHFFSPFFWKICTRLLGISEKCQKWPKMGQNPRC